MSTKPFKLILYVLDETGPYAKEIPNNVKIISLRRDWGKTQLRFAFLHYLLILIRERPKLVVSTLNSLNFLSIWGKYFSLSLGVKTICRQAENLHGKSKFELLLLKTIFHLADGCIALSEGVKKEMVSILKIQEKKITRIYNPLDLSHIGLKGSKDEPMNGQEKLIVNIGRLSAEKNQTFLLSAFAEFIKKKPAKFRLIIIGTGPLSEFLKSRAADLGISHQVDFTGFLENPYPYLKKATVLVSTSHREGLGHTILEAMALKVPILSSHVASGPLELIQSGETGLFYDPGNIPDFCEKLTSLTEDKVLTGSLTEKAYAFLLNHFGNQRPEKQYLETIQKVLHLNKNE